MSNAALGVLFDLDGTLADTAPDLGDALNQLLIQHGRAPLPFHRIRPQASDGSQGMIRLGFRLEPRDAAYETYRQAFIACYAERILRKTRLFPGIPEVLDALEVRGIPWGVVTNKPARLTEPLISGLGLEGRAGCVISGDTTPHRKPHPEPVFRACAQLGLAPWQCWLVGDAERDIAAGRAAGTRTLIARFGYIGPGEDPRTWGADGEISHPQALLDWLHEG